MGELLNTLRALGGSGRSDHIYREFEDNGVARRVDVERRQLSGETRFVKEVRFARKELVDAGLILNGPGGLWTLSSEGWRTYLTPDDARAIIRQRRHNLQPKSGDTAASVLADGPGPTKGPVPGKWTGTVTRSMEGGRWTYVFRFGESDVWKIGFAEDVDARLREVNTHIPIELLKVQWCHFARQRWSTAAVAYEQEQLLLADLGWARTERERVRCTEAEIRAAWKKLGTNAVAVDAVH
jgi:hypothetical protein